MQKKIIVKLSIPLVTVFIILLAAEIILRFSWEMGGWVKSPLYQRNYNPYLRYELIPGAKSGNVSINSAGFRGPEYPLGKPDNTFRIAMLGDSETLSVLLPQSETLPAQLENILNQRQHSLNYQVLNFGIEGYNTLQELELLKLKVLRYNPDLIILNYVLNDPEPGELFFNKTFFMRHSALVRYLSSRIKKLLIKRERKRLKINSEIEHFYYLHRPNNFIYAQKAILEMAEISRKQGGKLAVAIFPVSSIEVKGFKEKYPYYPLHKIVKSIKSENIIFIDLIDEINRLGLEPNDVAINYIHNESHKNAFALKIFTEYLYNILKNEKLISE